MMNIKLQLCKNRVVALLCFVIVLCSTQNVFSQSRIVRGVITDATTNETIPGVTIKLKSGTRSTLTNANGAFSIQAQSTDVLVVTSLGYLGKEVRVGDQSTINISLNENVQALDQVVVIGYGEVEKRDLTGSVGIVNVEEMAIAPVMSFDQALAGRVAGVNVSSGDGQPGEEAVSIVIRGMGSITQDAGPLYVIDGFPMEDFDASSLNTDDIESINILKDASATAIYGARGANGVVMIETKKGKIGAPVISYSTNLGIQQITKRMELMDSYEFVKYQNELGVTRYNPGDLAPGAAGFDILGNTLESYRQIGGIDWQEQVFQQGATNIHNLSLSGGTPQTRYSISGSLFDQKGVILESGADRVTGRISLDQTVNKKLKVGVNVSYSNTKSVGQIASANATSGGHAYGYLMYGTWAFRPITGNETVIDDFDEEFLEEEIDEEAGTGTSTTVNPVQTLRNEDRQSKVVTLNTTGYVNFEIAKNLVLRQTLGYKSRNSESYSFYNTKTGRGNPLLSDRGVQASLAYSKRDGWNSATTLTYRKRFTKSHYLTLLGGAEFQENLFENYGYGSQLIPNEALGLSGMDEGVPISQRVSFSNNTLASFFGRASYDYKSKYLFTATYRADGSSKFSTENKWAFFPSGAFAWRISKENFMKSLTFISDAKFRTSIGMTGNNRVSDFAYFSTLEGTTIAQSYSFNNGTPTRGFYPNTLGNKDLKWETTLQTDIGLDVSLFKNRVEIIADVYRKKTTDLLLRASIPESFGFSTMYDNVGELQNEGLELTLNTVNIKKKDFQWSTNFNISFNKNKVLALANNETRMFSRATWDTQHNGASLWVAQIGEPVALFMGHIWEGNYQYDDFDLMGNTYVLKKGIPDNGDPVQPGSIKYRDLNGDGTVSDADVAIIGDPNPKHVGGFANNLKYKGFGLNVFFQWSYGNDVFNANRIYFEGGRPQVARNQFATYVNRWSPENQNNEHFRLRGQGPIGRYSSRTIEDGSYIRLKTVSFSYSLPKKWIGALSLKNVTLSATAQNLHTWTNYSGMDPEVSTQRSLGALTPNFDWSGYPRAKTIVFGIKATL